jgi:hypothetical protein
MLSVRWDKLSEFPLRGIDMININEILLSPLPARSGREGEGQSALGLKWLRTGAPRQRPGRGESRHWIAGRPILAWLCIKSWDGSPLMETLLLRSINRSKWMKLILYIWPGDVVGITPIDPGLTVLSPGNHPGVYQQPKPEKGIVRNPGTFSRRPKWDRIVPAWWVKGQWRRSTPRAGKPSTWGRTPAGPIRPMQRHGAQGESFGT